MNAAADYKKAMKLDSVFQYTPKSEVIDKVERFGWTVVDRPGEFCLIDKGDLYVDQSYQRQRWNKKKINAMASNWSWVGCGTLTVAIRENQWWVMDGATRLAAANKRSDIKKLPCMIYELVGIEKEAMSFVCINNAKTPVNTFDRFKALIVGGDQVAIELNELIQSTGHHASNTSGSPKNIACLLTIWKLFQRDKKRFINLWPLITEINSDCAIIGSVVRGIYGAESAAMKQGISLTRAPISTFMVKAGGQFINASIQKEISIVGFGGPRIETNAVIKMLNKQKGLLKHKINLSE